METLVLESDAALVLFVVTGLFVTLLSIVADTASRLRLSGRSPA